MDLVLTQGSLTYWNYTGENDCLPHGKKKAFPSKKVVGNLACKKNFLFDDRYVFLGVLLKYSFVSPNDERESVKMRSE